MNWDWCFYFFFPIIISPCSYFHLLVCFSPSFFCFIFPFCSSSCIRTGRAHAQGQCGPVAASDGRHWGRWARASPRASALRGSPEPQCESAAPATSSPPSCSCGLRGRVLPWASPRRTVSRAPSRDLRFSRVARLSYFCVAMEVATADFEVFGKVQGE